MKLLRYLGVMVAVTLALATFPARADLLAGSGDVFMLNFDEYGNAAYTLDGVTWLTATATVGADPTGGVAGNVLIYTLPEIVTEGDVRVWEDSGETILSDVMRFTDVSGSLNGFGNLNDLLLGSRRQRPGR